jgi:N utilization substance protein A
MRTHPDDILRLQGIGPRAMTEITRLVDGLEATQKAELAAAAAEPLAAQAAPSVDEAALSAVETSETPAASVETPAGEIAAAQEPQAVGEIVPQAEEEPEPTFDALFALKPDMVPAVAEAEEEEEGDDKSKTGKKKKKKTKSVEITYDPDRDLVLTKKKHKRGDDFLNWEE